MPWKCFTEAISTNKDSRAGFNGAQILLHTYWRHMQSASMVSNMYLIKFARQSSSWFFVGGYCCRILTFSVKHFHGNSSYPYESYSWKRVSGFLASRIYSTYTTGHDLKTYLLCWSGSRCGQGPVLIVIWLHPTFVSMSLPLCKYLSRPRILPPLVPCTPFSKLRFGICTRLSVLAFSHLHHLHPHLIRSIYLISSHSLHSYLEQSFLK